MSSNALNAVYKTGILAIEEALLTVDADATDTTITVSGKYMSATPFVVGNTYIIQDTSWNALIPNAERILVTGTSLVATPLVDGIGYTVAGTLTILAHTANGFTGGLAGSYTMANGASVLTPGVEMAIQSADFNCRFKTLTDAPKIDFDDEASRFATGDEGRDLSIPGARSGEITFTEKLAWAGAVTTVPVWGKLMRSMGHLLRKFTTTGFEFIPHTWANETTATIWIIAPENGSSPCSTVYRYRGAHGGNGSSISAGKIGDPYMLTAKYSAAYVGTMELTNAQTRSITAIETKVPEVLLNNSVNLPAVYGHSCIPSAYADIAALVTGESLTVGARFYTSNGSDTVNGALATAKGSALKAGDQFLVATLSTCTFANIYKPAVISQFSLDFGGTVNPYIDQSTSTGNAFFVTSDRDPKLTLNPYHVGKKHDDIDFELTNSVIGEISIASALASPHMTIYVGNAQQLMPSLASREGYINTNRTYRALRNDIGFGPAAPSIPPQVMYSILIGARS